MSSLPLPMDIVYMFVFILGIGYGMVVLTAIVAIYYTVIMSWTLYYLAMSFSGTLPWSHCNNAWNSPACYSRVNEEITASDNITSLANNGASLGDVSNMTANDAFYATMNNTLLQYDIIRRTPTEEFWE